MKNKELGKSIVVVGALLAFIVISILLFFNSYDLLVDGNLPSDYSTKLNSVLVYLSNGLTGFVGGVIASGFGVKQPTDLNEQSQEKSKSFKLENLGSFATPIKKSDKFKENIGLAYVISYFAVGCAAIVIWYNLQDDLIPTVKHMAMTFFGLVLVIGSQFFND